MMSCAVAGSLLFLMTGAAGNQVPDTAISSAITVEHPVLVQVDGGTFTMGSNRGVADEKPPHTVTLSDFMIGKYEVTQQEWRSVMGDDHAFFHHDCDSCPADNVSYIRIMEYFTKLNLATGGNYRLPSEAEWEYAARGGNLSRGYRYSGSNHADSVAWKPGNAGNSSHPVGLKKPNELGIHDMSGNVWEWCADFYQPDYYRYSIRENPRGPLTGTHYVIRGGSWYFDSTGLQVTDRDKSTPEVRYGYVGFRICRSIP